MLTMSHLNMNMNIEHPNGTADYMLSDDAICCHTSSRKNGKQNLLWRFNMSDVDGCIRESFKLELITEVRMKCVIKMLFLCIF